MTLTPGIVPAQTTIQPTKGAQLDGTLNQTLDSAKDPSGKTLTLTEHEGTFLRHPAHKGATIDGHIDDVNPPNGTVAGVATGFAFVNTLDRLRVNHEIVPGTST